MALILGLFVVRPILSGGPAQALPAPPGQEVLPPEAAAQDTAPDAEAAQQGGATIDSQPAVEIDPVARLRRLIEERQDETVQILQSWIEEPDKKEHV